MVIITEGLRMVVPALGMKLHRMPFLGLLKNLEVWHDLDIAPFAATLLFVCTSYIWCALIEAWLYDDYGVTTSGPNLERYQRGLAGLGGIILCADACLFYQAMTMAAWGAKTLSLPSLLCTLTYLAILVSVCVVSVNLKRNYLSFKRGKTPYGA